MTRVAEMGSLSPPVSWRGLSAIYGHGERQIVRQLPRSEQWFVHVLKAFTDGEIAEGQGPGKSETIGSTIGSAVSSETRLSLESKNASPPPAIEGVETDKRTAHSRVTPVSSPSVYIDPEDIPFGDKPKRTKKIYAVAWTWRKHRVCKTKGKAQLKLKVWKRWYERQGWKVSSHANGYYAQKEGDRHSISLHEYDAATLERL